MVKRRTVVTITFVSILVFIGCGMPGACDKAVCFETPLVVNRLEIHGTCGERIWALRGDGKTATGDISYGSAPRGYQQIFPVSAPPRNLRPGECVVLLWNDRDHFTRHWGVAASRGAVDYGAWMSQPVKGSPDKLFTPGGENEPRQSNCGKCAA